MSLMIARREREGIVILDLDGPLTLGEQASDLRECLRTLGEAGTVSVALNLKNVSKIDSTGLGMLVAGFVKLRKAGGRLALFNLNRFHLNLLLLTKLVTVFEIFPEEQGAVDSCFPERGTKRYDILSYVQDENPGEVAVAQ